MTWVEVALVLSVLGLIAGIVRRGHPAGRRLAGLSMAVFLILAVLYGGELVRDLF